MPNWSIFEFHIPLRSHTLFGANYISLYFFLVETNRDRLNRPGAELLFNIPEFLRSMFCCKKETWSLSSDSSLEELHSLEKNETKVYII